MSVNGAVAGLKDKKQTQQTLLTSHEKSVRSEAAVLAGRLDGSAEMRARTEWSEPTMSDGEDGEMTAKGVR